MQPTLLLRLEHALMPGRDAAVASAIAEIMGRPCFAPLKRMSLETYSGRNMRYTKPSAEAIQAYLCDPLCDVVDLDSGRQGELIAAARLPTGLLTRPQSWVAYPAPLEIYIIVPHDPALTRARIDAFCDLSVAVQATAGCVSVENSFGLAHRVIGEALVEEPYRRFIPVLRAEYELTREQVLKLRGHAQLLADEPTVQRSIVLRNPYIDPMHLVQVDLLRRWRAGGRSDREMLAALVATVGGISQALQGA